MALDADKLGNDILNILKPNEPFDRQIICKNLAQAIIEHIKQFGEVKVNTIVTTNTGSGTGSGSGIIS